MKIMSIIGIPWFILCCFCIYAFEGNRYGTAAVGWNYLGLFYAIALTIVVEVITSKEQNHEPFAKVVKIMSRFGIVWFLLCMLITILSQYVFNDEKGAGNLGYFGMFYAIPFSIVVLVFTIKNKKNEKDINKDKYNDLVLLHELKEKGIITDEEFQIKKTSFLQK